MTHAGTIHEFPRAPVIVQFHPRGDRPFTLEALERALRLGVHSVELDLGWRPADAQVVCSHGRRDLPGAPTLEQALDTILRFQGGSSTVRKDGHQFFLFLDLKDETPAFHHALIGALAGHASRLSTAGAPAPGPRGITVVITGFRAALERAVEPATLDTLAIVEGRDYRGRIRDLRGGRFQWVALDAPVERSRIDAIHEGRDGRFRGRFNVRVVAAHRYLESAIRSGADAVNADPEELEAALRSAASVRGSGSRP